MDCGPFCLAFLVNHYGKTIEINYLRLLCHASNSGVSLFALNQAAVELGFATKAYQLEYNDIRQEVVLPCIAFIDGNHFVVIKKITKENVTLYDPAIGLCKISKPSFLERWIVSNTTGYVLECVPTESFTTKMFPQEESKPRITDTFRFILPFRSDVIRIILGLILSSIIQLLFPILTKNVVDVGIEGRNISALIIILCGQVMLVLGSVLVSFIEARIVLYVGSRINVHLVYEFFCKLVRLPISFFGTRQSGDILQRVSDQHRIESFITNSLLEILLSSFNFVVFSCLLIKYSPLIFLCIIIDQALYITWICLFLNKRRRLDYEMFSRMTETQDSVIEIVRGMQEIKLCNCYQPKIKSWLQLQKKLYDTKNNNLKLEQLQESGTTFLGELLNVVILFISAIKVIGGQLTFGTMLAIQNISGQLSGSIQRAVVLIHDVQDTKIAMERLQHISNHEQENSADAKAMIDDSDVEILIDNLSFTYPGTETPVLKNVSLTFKKNSTTAIVGASGGGKSTLLKMILGFYKPDSGSIKINDKNLTSVDLDKWRSSCGVVMQDGYIFSGTIGENICPVETKGATEDLWEAARIANIDVFIKSLPLGMKTKIGMNGKDLSGGQKQRILIARAIFKSPKVLLFDEATNSLDAQNESEIWRRMEQLFSNRTAIIIAHRLSTIRFADRIVVLDNGEIKEVGNHAQLMQKKGIYYQMINSQLQS